MPIQESCAPTRAPPLERRRINRPTIRTYFNENVSNQHNAPISPLRLLPEPTGSLSKKGVSGTRRPMRTMRFNHWASAQIHRPGQPTLQPLQDQPDNPLPQNLLRATRAKCRLSRLPKVPCCPFQHRTADRERHSTQPKTPSH